MTETGGPVVDADCWRCPACGVDNPAGSPSTRCGSCGADPTAPALPGLVRVVNPTPRGRWIALLTWLYAIAVLVALGLIRWVGQAWWPVAILIFMPRWLLLGPIVLLAIASTIKKRPAHWALQGALAVVVLGPVMGLTVPLYRLWKPDAEGERFRVMTFNTGSVPIDSRGLIRMIERERIDVICFQEGQASDPALDAFFEQGWYRDASKFLASRFPIVDEMDSLTDDSTTEDRYGARLNRIRVRTLSGTDVVVASVHMPTVRLGFDRLFAGKPQGLQLHVRWWSHELDRVVKSLAESSDVPLLIGGDFNMPSDDSTMSALRPFFRFAFEETGWGFGYTRPSRIPWVRIDHLMVSPEWTFTRCWVGPDLGSDHLPLIAEVVAPEPPRRASIPQPALPR